MRAAAITPAERSVLVSLASRPMPAFPVKLAGRLPHCWFRGLRSVHFALQPAWSLGHPRRPFCIEVLQTMSLPPSSAPTVTGWSDSCRAGFAPAEKWRLVTAHSRVEGRRVTGRARWLIRRFRTGPQSEAHRHVSSPRSPNPACRFPAPGSPVESCGSHTGFPGATSGRVSRSRGTRLAPLRRSTGWVVRPVDALTTATARAVPFAYACDDVRHCCSSPG